MTIRPHDLVLFQGDSITNAFRMPDEPCNAYQLGAGYAMMVSAWLLAARPHDHLRFVNRGVSGEAVAGLRRRWQADCLELRPDVLSILVGVNDASVMEATRRTTLEEYESQYRDLLSVTRRALPDVRLVLCEPFVLPVANVRPEAPADLARRGAIVRRLAAEFGAILVPLQQVFADAVARAPASYWSYDGIHPNAQGHWLIAQAWVRAVTGSSAECPPLLTQTGEHP